jgi:hypothetical protein
VSEAAQLPDRSSVGSFDFQHTNLLASFLAKKNPNKTFVTKHFLFDTALTMHSKSACWQQLIETVERH